MVQDSIAQLWPDSNRAPAARKFLSQCSQPGHLALKIFSVAESVYLSSDRCAHGLHRPRARNLFSGTVYSTKVLCAVYGPHAQTGRDSAFSEEGQLQCEFSYAPFATPGGRRETRGGKTNDERELSTLLRQTLESSVQVNKYTTSYV